MHEFENGLYEKKKFVLFEMKFVEALFSGSAHKLFVYVWNVLYLLPHHVAYRWDEMEQLI